MESRREHDCLAGVALWQPVLGTPADVLNIVVFMVKLNVEPGTVFPAALKILFYFHPPFVH